jgi:signal transduction histidine kinase
MSASAALSQRFATQVLLIVAIGMASLAALLAFTYEYRITQWYTNTAIVSATHVASLIAQQTQRDLLDNPSNTDLPATRALIAAFPNIKHLTVLRPGNQMIRFGADMPLPPEFMRNSVGATQLLYDLGETLHYQVRIPSDTTDDSDYLGYAYVVFTKSVLDGTGWSTLIITILVIGIVLAVLAFVIGRITRPLSDLSSMLTETQQGKNWPDSQPYGTQEIVRLWQQLTSVIQSLEKQRNEFNTATIEKKYEIDEHDGTRQELISRINATLEQERKHLARVLHDEINVTLFAIRLRLQHLHQLMMKGWNSETRKKIENDLVDVIGMLTSAYNNNRYTSNQLRSESIEQLGLVGAITTTLQYYNGIEGCRFSIQADKTLPYFKDSAGLAVFRVIEECVVNIVKHAQASRALITLNPLRPDDFEVLETLDFVDRDKEKYDSFKAMVDRQVNDYVHIVIQDNGVGIPRDIYSKQRKGGIGLLNMQERLNSVSGCLLVSLESPGTRTDILFKKIR